MTTATRTIRAPRGTSLTCKGWPQEAALRMLMNNLDPDVAERPDDLVVYGGSGKAARNWESYDAIVRSLTALEHDETLLVVDGTSGQNAISQATLFHAATPLTGVIVTKLDSTAKGGVLVAIVDTLTLPIKFIGIGEAIDELRPFEPAAFVEALFEPAAA